MQDYASDVVFRFDFQYERFTGPRLATIKDFRDFQQCFHRQSPFSPGLRILTIWMVKSRRRPYVHLN